MDNCKAIIDPKFEVLEIVDNIINNDNLVNDVLNLAEKKATELAKNKIDEVLNDSPLSLIGSVINAKDTIENLNFTDQSVDLAIANSNVGTTENKAFANASLAEFQANLGNVASVKADALSASAHAEYGWNNSVGAEAALVKVEGSVGPVKMSTGLNADCNAHVGIDGIGATFLGTGFSIGLKPKISTPFFSIGF